MPTLAEKQRIDELIAQVKVIIAEQHELLVSIVPGMSQSEKDAIQAKANANQAVIERLLDEAKTLDARPDTPTTAPPVDPAVSPAAAQAEVDTQVSIESVITEPPVPDGDGAD